MTPLYRQLAEHYLQAIHAGALRGGDRLPSVRRLMNDHGVSLATALQACRHLEDQGWLEARPRSGYYVRGARRLSLPPAAEPEQAAPDPAAYVGIHERVSSILERGQRVPVAVNLALAVGAPELYPAAALQRGMQGQLRRHPAILTTMARRHGHPAFRQALARHLLARGVPAAPEEVVVTHGCVEAVNLALRAVTKPGDTVAVESPTFYGVLQVLESLGLRALELPTSPRTGLSLDALEFVLREGAPGGQRVKAIVAMPTLHNPLGCTMPDAHKQRLAALCTEHDVALVEDDIYGEMGDADAPIRPVKAFDRSGHVIHCGSLNKVLAPGLRLGWVLPGRWQARIEMLKYAQSRYGEELPQLVAAEFIGGSGWPRHLRRLRAALQVQRRAMAEAVAAHFPEGTRCSLPEGGMLLWVQLPEAVDAEALFDAALAEGIKLSPGSMFGNAARFANCLRLSCGQPHGAAVAAAVRRVGELARSLRAG